MIYCTFYDQSVYAMSYLKMIRENKQVSITTRDWLEWLVREKQKTSFKRITKTAVLDSLIIAEYMAMKNSKDKPKKQDKSLEASA